MAGVLDNLVATSVTTPAPATETDNVQDQEHFEQQYMHLHEEEEENHLLAALPLANKVYRNLNRSNRPILIV